MKSWLFKSILIVCVFAVTWIMALYYWQTSHRVPNGFDIGIYFLAIPLGILLTLWLAVISWNTIKNKTNLPEVTDSTADSTDSAGDEQGRLLSATILSSAVYMQHGQSSGELFNAVKSNALEMSLDPQLVDANGFPILTARIADLDEETQRTLLSEWAEDHQLTVTSWTSEQIRAIAASSEVVKQLLFEALNHPSIDSYLEETNLHQKALIELPSLTLSFFHPAHWNKSVCETTQAWLESMAQEQGWPKEKFNIKLYPQRHFIQSVKLLDNIMTEGHTHSHPIFNMVISCASFIDETVADSWTTHLTQLFGEKYDPHAIPSEGAAGLLISDKSIAALYESSSKTTLHKPWFLEIDTNQQSSDTERKNILADLISHALENIKITADQIKFVSSDTSSYSKKLLELFNIGGDLFPNLDAGEHYFSSSNQCGITGTSASLLGLSLAHEAVKQNENDAAVFISHMDQNTRAVAIINAYNSIEPPEHQPS